MATLLSTSSDPVGGSSSATPLTPTIFHESWWLQAVTGGAYQQVSVHSGGREVGRLPFVHRRQYGMRECILPELTPFLGPAVDEGRGRIVQRHHNQRQIVGELIAQLPPHSRFHQRLHAELADATAFRRAGFDTSVDFTFEIAPAATAALWSGMRDKTRNIIRRAQEQGSIYAMEPEAFCAFYRRNLTLHNKATNYMWRDGALPVMIAALDRDRARVLALCNARGETQAAIVVVWDARTCYLLLTTRTPASHAGAVSLLIWDAIKQAAAGGRTFDFGGVGTSGSVLFYSGFGGDVRPRYVAHRTTRAFRAVDHAARKLRSLQGRIALALAPPPYGPAYGVAGGPATGEARGLTSSLALP